MKFSLLLCCLGLMTAAVVADTHYCAQFMTCEICVTHNLCGWCSEPVVYPNNVTGAQCAGFNNNGSDPFACNGIYSTDQCVRGYTCDPYNFTCVLAAPGAGQTLQQCEANCTNQGQVYLCNLTTHQCVEVNGNQPNNGSYANCMAECQHPSAHPSSSSPSPSATTYVCNTTSGQCVTSTPGHGSSLQVCEQECHQINGTQYMCNQFLSQCIKLPPGVSGETLAQCEAQCNPSPNPGPPPAFLGGMWRGIAIQTNYQEGEWDMNFTETTAVIVDVATATTIKGIPYNVKINDQVIFIINITSGPGAGQTMKGIGQQDNRGPETFYLTAAFSAPGDEAPTSITAAMTDPTKKVFALSQCAGTPECVFIMPSTQPQRRQFQEQSLKATVNDPCEQYGQNCSYCLSHEYCGWCSTDVTYADGQKGSQCAGFSNNANQSNAFVCSGRYSTFNCTTGYDCDNTTNQCVPDPIPGNGMPMAECQQLCRPTPPPTPNPNQWICNISTKTCYKCNATFCPGAMPESTCAAACIKPKPGPTGLVTGLWRGIQIQNQYPLAEFEWLFNSSGLQVFKQGTLQWGATIISLGGDVMIFTVTSGPNSGKTISGIYSVQNQAGPLYSIMTLALGAPNGGIPPSYAASMETAGEIEVVLNKCVQAPCKFSNP